MDSDHSPGPSGPTFGFNECVVTYDDFNMPTGINDIILYLDEIKEDVETKIKAYCPAHLPQWQREFGSWLDKNIDNMQHPQSGDGAATRVIQPHSDIVQSAVPQFTIDACLNDTSSSLTEIQSTPALQAIRTLNINSSSPSTSPISRPSASATHSVYTTAEAAPNSSVTNTNLASLQLSTRLAPRLTPSLSPSSDQQLDACIMTFDHQSSKQLNRTQGKRNSKPQTLKESGSKRQAPNNALNPFKRSRRLYQRAGKEPSDVTIDARSTRDPNDDDLLEFYIAFEEEEQKMIAQKTVAGHQENYSEHQFSPLELFDELANSNSHQLQQSLKEKQIEKIVRLVTATAGKVTLNSFLDITKQFRASNFNSTSTDINLIIRNSPSLGATLKVLRKLNSQEAYNKLLKRFHLVKLAEQFDAKVKMLIDSHLNGSGGRPRRPGNPIIAAQSTAKEEAIQQALREANPEFVSATSSVTAYQRERFNPKWEAAKKDLDRDLKLGRRWKRLTDQYGLGMLPLIPPEREYVHQVSDYMIEKLTEPMFELFLAALQKYKGFTVQEMSEGIERFINAALQNNLTENMKLVLEDQQSEDILCEPDSSPRLREFMKLNASSLI